MTPHVSDVEIERLSRRELPPDALIRVTDHLVACAECQKRAFAEEPSARADRRILGELLAIGPHVPEEEIHSYVRRRLSAQRQAEIERHLTNCPSCTAEIRDLEAFADGLRFASRRRAWSYAAVAAAAAVLVVGIGRTVVRREGAAHDTLAQRAAPPQQAQPQRVAPPAPASVAQSTPESGQQAPESNSAVILALNVRPVRALDTSAPPTVAVGQEIHEVIVRLALREIDYPRYQVNLRLAGGAERFNKAHLEPQNRQSAPVLVISVPAEALPAGDYILTLKGEGPAGNVEDVSTSFFRLKRK